MTRSAPVPVTRIHPSALPTIRAGNALWQRLLHRLRRDWGAEGEPEKWLEAIEETYFRREALCFDLENAWQQHFGLSRQEALRSLSGLRRVPGPRQAGACRSEPVQV